MMAQSVAAEEFRRLAAANGVTCLSELREGQFGKSVFGIVRDKAERGKTRTNESKLSLVLVDPSAPSAPMRVNSFSKNKNELPLLVEAGTVVRIDSCKIQDFNKKPQGVTKTGARLHVFDVPAGIPQDSSNDWQMACLLHTWFHGTDEAGNTPASSINSGTRKTYAISQIQKDREFFDLFCQVMYVIPGGRNDQMMVLVSDFTKAAFSLSLSEEEQNYLLYPASDMLLKVTIWLNEEEQANTATFTDALAPRIECGSFVYFRNLQGQQRDDGAIDAVLHNERESRSIGGKWTLLDHEDPHVLQLRTRVEALGLIKNRFATGLTRTPLHVTKTTIRDILETIEVPQMFRVDAAVVDHMPTAVESFSRVICRACECRYVFCCVQSLSNNDWSFSFEDEACSGCGRDDTGITSFRFSFLLDDGTDFLPVTVSGSEAVSVVTSHGLKLSLVCFERQGY
ncbi:hypothetical protein BC830DRAFT_1123640 [Chytriomyces sp. MP71]|nr:hypothetical protein BC830DRAFT_1123640 [Chytriomyces sp. MP71]